MSPSIITLLVLWSGWRAYRKMRQAGTWSNKQFLVTLLAGLGLCAVISFPIIFISPETMQAHEGLAIASILLAIFVGVALLTIYANRWKKRDDLKRSGQNRSVGVAIITLLLFGAGASAQTTYRDPGGSFTVSVPAGWQAEKQQDGSGVKISKGDVSATVAVDSTNDGSTPPPKVVLDSFEQQFLQNCPSPEGSPRRGDATVAGLPGLYSQLSCNDQEHGTWMMMFAVATSNGKILLFQSSVPSSQYSSVKPALDSMAKSFRLDGAGMPGAGSGTELPRTQGNTASAGNAQKLKALEDACSSGVLTQNECAAKRAELTSGGSSSNSSGNNPQLQALQRACNAGVFTPQECKAKRAALTGAGSNEGQGNDQAPPPARPNGQNGSSSPDHANPQPTSSGGNLDKDPQGAFSIMIPQGWTAKTNRGCYGPPENCPPNAAGVNITTQGKSWGFVAPFSGNARQPTDVVKSVAEHVRSQYQNFEILQNDPEKLNGLNIAVGHFTGIDQEGESVSLVVIAIAAPGGRYLVAESFVPQSEMQTAGPALSSMPGSLRFAGQ